MMDSEELERRKEVAMRTIRPMVCKELDKIMQEHDVMETLEDSVIEALVDAGIDAPVDPDADPEGVDQAIELVQQCVDEATKFWHGDCHGPVWVLLGFNNDAGIKGLEVEIFGDRPHTWEHGGEWPDWFRVYEGNIDGGDTVIGDAKGANFG